MNGILYISYDGMTDPLGQSQVIPYLTGLAKKNYSITILSAEKRNIPYSEIVRISKHLKENHIHWHFIWYTKTPPVISTLWDLLKWFCLSLHLYKKNRFRIVHCRSYIAAFIGFFLKKMFGTAFVFDMRGFYPEERIEGGIWNPDRFMYKFIYRFFKRKETAFLKRADYIISLTEEGRKIIQSRKPFQSVTLPIEVIPCCTDTEYFSPDGISPEKSDHFRRVLDIHKNDFILSYLGSTGTWYLLDEMLLFFKQLIQQKIHSKFLFITRDDPGMIFSRAEKLGILTDSIRIIPSGREDLPSLISLCTCFIIFIKPVFSKKASCPTKLGEILAMGKPVICNSGIGDIDAIISESGAGVLLYDFNEKNFDEAIHKLDDLLRLPQKKFIFSAQKYFSLKQGIEMYHTVYQKILTQD